MLRSMTHCEMHRLTISEGAIGKVNRHRPKLTQERRRRGLIREARRNISRRHIGGTNRKRLVIREKDDAWINIVEVLVIDQVQTIVTAGCVTRGCCGRFLIKDDAGERARSAILKGKRIRVPRAGARVKAIVTFGLEED